jgi:hypothetical protein
VARVQYTMYPPSLYENIVRGAALGVPMYVTEIGCADKSKDDHIRLANIESSMHQACFRFSLHNDVILCVQTLLW